MLQVRQAHAMYSGPVLKVSCEYLDEHDHTLALRMIGIDSRYVAGTRSLCHVLRLRVDVLLRVPVRTRYAAGTKAYAMYSGHLLTFSCEYLYEHVMLQVQEAYAMYSGHVLMFSCEYLYEHVMLQVQEAYAVYSGHVLMFSCEYLDEHDHTVALRLFGLTSLVLFVGLIITTIVSYGKIYDKVPTALILFPLSTRAPYVFGLNEMTL